MSVLVDSSTITVEAKTAGARARSIAALAVFVLSFAAVAPFRGALAADNPLERATMVTVMEMWQSGRWFYPTLNGQPRLAKPPLAAWISAIFTRKETIDALGSGDDAVRH